MSQETVNGTMRLTVISVAAGANTTHVCEKSTTYLEIQNTSTVPGFFGRTAITDATGYVLKPMSAAAAYDGGIFNTTKYNGRLYFYNPPAAPAVLEVRIVEIG